MLRLSLHLLFNLPKSTVKRLWFWTLILQKHQWLIQNSWTYIVAQITRPNFLKCILNLHVIKTHLSNYNMRILQLNQTFKYATFYIFHLKKIRLLCKFPIRQFMSFIKIIFYWIIKFFSKFYLLFAWNN